MYLNFPPDDNYRKSMLTMKIMIHNRIPLPAYFVKAQLINSMFSKSTFFFFFFGLDYSVWAGLSNML